MTPPDYEYLRKILKERSGLDLSADKQYLVESRLAPLARKAGFPGIPVNAWYRLLPPAFVTGKLLRELCETGAGG